MHALEVVLKFRMLFWGQYSIKFQKMPSNLPKWQYLRCCSYLWLRFYDLWPLVKWTEYLGNNPVDLDALRMQFADKTCPKMSQKWHIYLFKWPFQHMSLVGIYTTFVMGPKPSQMRHFPSRNSILCPGWSKRTGPFRQILISKY